MAELPYLQTKEHTLWPIISNKHTERDRRQSTSLLENWNRQFKRWLSKVGSLKHEGLAQMPSRAYAHTQREHECPHWTGFSVFLVDLGMG